MTYQAKATQYKKDAVKVLAQSMEQYPVVGLVNVENLPAKQLQVLRLKLRKDVYITMNKKLLIKRAIDSVKSKKNFEKLADSIVGMPALLFTKQNPFKISALIKASKSKAPAKPGQIAPFDLIVPAGPTSFTPGPIISELGQAGLKAGVEDGKVVIKEDSVVVKKDEEITDNTASVLAKFNIEPMEIGLDLVAAYEDGLIYGKDVLSIDPAEYLSMVHKAASETLALTIEIAYVTKDNIERLIATAYNTTKNFALDQNIVSDVVLEKDISNAERAAKSIGEAANITETPAEPAKEEPKQETAEPAADKKEEPTPPAPEVKEQPKPEPQQPEVKKEPEQPAPEVKPAEKPEEKKEEPKAEETKKPADLSSAEKISTDFKEEIAAEKETRDNVDSQQAEELANKLKKKGTLRQ
ncbi:50S ribosomal protein L10 [Candidatus Woesearchaeota archaeon]|nr:50S ribosomal protein L10 [Candidatus Woesearchaeota archaeon]|tara:strand:- start:1139 stop:2371 length:1233 start_codon:yes stop_codon:yes gene_type:complete